MDARRSGTIRNIREFLNREDWVHGQYEIEFLAAGEYNENYWIRANQGEFVFRINHGTQLGLEDQSSYEFDVLGAVYPSGATPQPLKLQPSDPFFPRGAMLIEYIPGIRFDYERDWAAAARLFASIHRLPASGRLIRQATPVADIVAESVELLDRHSPHPLADTGDLIRDYATDIAEVAGSADLDMQDEQLCIVNTEVNSGNFISPSRAPDGRLKLVDWEKAVVSYRYQDLGHFLVPTTTLWKTEFRFSAELRRAFLEEYQAAIHPAVSLDDLDRRTAVLERTIVLRALSWCYMAYVEYTNNDRPLRSAGTFERINLYLENAASFIGR
ncbi:MAG: aminoglycoside phosphotransferase family protein [Spirochaetia bacterium]